tara:strand:+ start:184 stop:378 length:195 start_codon:yes stop_codon:yes gene_type:complete
MANNNYIAPKIGDYKLTITNKKTKEVVFTSNSKNQNTLIQIMDQFPKSKYSKKITGSDLYLYEA